MITVSKNGATKVACADAHEHIAAGQELRSDTHGQSASRPQMCTTVERRSAPCRSAASRYMACPAWTEIHTSYFSLGDSRQRGFLPFTARSDVINSLPVSHAGDRRCSHWLFLLA
ncbi:MAG: hypothetical protein WKF73_18725 [Nocardioidaceae bacterium]